MLSNYLLYPVLELKGFILFSLGAMVFLTVFCLILMGRKKYGMEDFGWQASLFCLNNREIFGVVLGISQVLFVFSSIFFRMPMGLVQVTALGFLCIAKGILQLSLTGLASELIYGLMMGMALLVENLLRDYMEETGAELYIGLIWGLLSLFVLQYSIYYLIKSVERILRKHERAGKRQK